jgi:hypothetical protein
MRTKLLSEVEDDEYIIEVNSLYKYLIYYKNILLKWYIFTYWFMNQVLCGKFIYYINLYN